MMSPTLAAAFKSGVRWDAVGSGTQRIQAVQGVVPPVSATTTSSSSSSQMGELLSLRVPIVSKTAVSDVAAFLTGRILQSLSHTHKNIQIIGCQLQYLSPLCVWWDLPGREWVVCFVWPLILADKVTISIRFHTIYKGVPFKWDNFTVFSSLPSLSK